MRSVGEIVHEMWEIYSCICIDWTLSSRNIRVDHGSHCAVRWYLLSRRIHVVLVAEFVRKLVMSASFALDCLLAQFSDSKSAPAEKGRGPLRRFGVVYSARCHCECALCARRELNYRSHIVSLPSTAAPEESWYQPMPMSQEFSDRIKANRPGTVVKSYKTYARFNTERNPSRGTCRPLHRVTSRCCGN